MKSSSAKVRIFKNMVIAESGCWIWTGYYDEHGYGRVRFRGRTTYAHRLSACAFQPGFYLSSPLVVHHTCGVRGCVNPQHLELMSRSDHSQMHARDYIE